MMACFIPSLDPPRVWTLENFVETSRQIVKYPSRVGYQFLKYLLTSRKCISSLVLILLVDSEETGVYDFSLELDVHDFILFDPILGNFLLHHSGELVSLLEDSIIEAQHHVQRRLLYRLKNSNTLKPSIKGIKNTRIHVRLVHLPPHIACCLPSIASITSDDIGKVIQIQGTVVRASKVQMYESQRSYQCYSKNCGKVFVQRADLKTQNNALDVPNCCPVAGCLGSKIKLLPDGTVRSDYQEIKIQDSISNRGEFRTSLPRSLLVKLQHDLVDQCQPGDDIVIVGTLLPHWNPSLALMSECNVSLAIQAHSVKLVQNNDSSSSWEYILNQSKRINDFSPDSSQQNNKGPIQDDIMSEFTEYWSRNKHQPIALRNRICQSVCPLLYGMSNVKIALLLALIGGSNVGQERSSKRNIDTFSSKDDLNNLTTNKRPKNRRPSYFSFDYSHFNIYSNEKKIHYRNELFERTKNELFNKVTVQIKRRETCHLMLIGDPGTGKSQFLRFAAALCPRSILTSGSGTTSAGLTAAAVRDDSGREFILEAGALVLADRGVCAIDEFSCISKNDQTTIHEAMEQQTLSIAKAGIVCKLNCRTTIIAVTNPVGGLYDNDKSFCYNAGISVPLLSRFDLIFKLIDSNDEVKDDSVATFLLNHSIQGDGYSRPNKRSDVNHDSLFWSIEKLRAYIATVKSLFHPTLTSPAGLLLQKHYETCRLSNQMALGVTIRFFESLIRLAQAHARLMFRNVVDIDDAVSIILLMESSVATTSSDRIDSLCMFQDPLNSNFPMNCEADKKFLCDKVAVLTHYNMSDYLTDHDRKLFSKSNEI